MKLPLKWLKEYIDYDVTHEEFVEKMMWRGFEIAEVIPELPEVCGVVVGEIKSVAQHPDADKLHVCTVDTGEEDIRTIVCGAPNVYEGMYAPVALPGAKLPGGLEIQPTVMRGVKSDGMLCSGKELGLTDADYPGSEVHGLLDLQGEQKPGMDIADALDMTGVVFDVELTPNRPDCQSIIGMVREAAAALNKPFQEPEVKEVKAEGAAEDYAKVTVLNTELCPRYAARVVTDIRIEPSPEWLQKKLRSVGLRPINNIVDITNLVMVEYGHPMHAFDLACVAEGHIVVRNADKGEIVTTLDSKERPVDESMLLIADPKKGVGIAGVMGGENSEITENTKAVLFEAAVFKGSNIRATARKLKLTTDAAARFIKGVEAVNAKKALDRAIELVVALGAGRVVGDTIDACAVDLKDRKVDVSAAHINKILNTAIPASQMADMLATIHVPAVPDGDTLHIEVPHYRTDIESGVEADWDIAEEIARIYGYYNIAPTLMRGDTFRGRLTPPFQFDDMLKDFLAAFGAYEMYNYNFTGPAVLDALLLKEGDEKRQAVKILNPFGEDQSLMRTTLLPGMLKVAALNLNRRTGHGRFFEVGNIHLDNNPILPEEHKRIGVLCFGENESFFTLKGILEQLLDAFNIHGAAFVRGGGPYLHPGRCAKLMVDGQMIGELGEMHPDVAASFDLEERVYVAELSFKALFALYKRERKYKPLPRYPVVLRDLAVIAAEETLAADLQAVIKNADTDLIIEDVQLFDVFRGGNIEADKKSLAYSFSLRSNDHTLQEEEIKKAMDSILLALDSAGAKLRS
ncbi:phenylalanine--tRNA ligase subunit beta [Christensenellaceae bacterium OttesenSCG-928-M15]|nr:phenylalanine--tRNA ligase subunit beta [Christensenellaceae bacterium OttesenSCG-928-M15]